MVGIDELIEELDRDVVFADFIRWTRQDMDPAKWVDLEFAVLNRRGVDNFCRTIATEMRMRFEGAASAEQMEVIERDGPRFFQAISEHLKWHGIPKYCIPADLEDILNDLPF